MKEFDFINKVQTVIVIQVGCPFMASTAAFSCVLVSVEVDYESRSTSTMFGYMWLD